LQTENVAPYCFLIVESNQIKSNQIKSNQIKLSILLSNNKNVVDIKFSAHDVQYQNIGKSGYLKVFVSNKLKNLNRRANL
jgi:hypothetical protein